MDSFFTGANLTWIIGIQNLQVVSVLEAVLRISI